MMEQSILFLAMISSSQAFRAMPGYGGAGNYGNYGGTEGSEAYVRLIAPNGNSFTGGTQVNCRNSGEHFEALQMMLDADSGCFVASKSARINGKAYDVNDGNFEWGIIEFNPDCLAAGGHYASFDTEFTYAVYAQNVAPGVESMGDILDTILGKTSFTDSAIAELATGLFTEFYRSSHASTAALGASIGANQSISAMDHAVIYGTDPYYCWSGAEMDIEPHWYEAAECAASIVYGDGATASPCADVTTTNEPYYPGTTDQPYYPSTTDQPYHPNATSAPEKPEEPVNPDGDDSTVTEVNCAKSGENFEVFKKFVADSIECVESFTSVPIAGKVYGGADENFEVGLMAFAPCATTGAYTNFIGIADCAIYVQSVGAKGVMMSEIFAKAGFDESSFTDAKLPQLLSGAMEDLDHFWPANKAALTGSIRANQSITASGYFVMHMVDPSYRWCTAWTEPQGYEDASTNACAASIEYPDGSTGSDCADAYSHHRDTTYDE